MSGPKSIGEVADGLTASLAQLHKSVQERHRKRVEAAARPGETFEQAENRLRAEDAAREQEEAQAKAKARAAAIAASAERERKEAAAKAAPSSVRKPPSGDAQMDFLVPGLYELGGRDNRSLMDVAVYRLSKTNKRAGEIIRYELPDGYIEVKAGPDGMASIWDYDIVVMMTSHLNEAANRWREGKADNRAAHSSRMHRTFSNLPAVVTVPGRWRNSKPR